MRPSSPRALLILAIIFLNIVSTRSGQFSSFRIDTTRSTIKLHGSVLAFALNWNLNYQEIGSLDAPCEGTLLIERTGDSVQIVHGKLSFRDTGSWEPDHFGLPGRAPANYGARSGSDVGNMRIIGLTALRECAISLGRTNLTLTNQTFGIRKIPVQFIERSVLDYRFLLFIRDDIDPDSAPSPNRFPNFMEPRKVAAGRAPLLGFLENRATNFAQFTINQEKEILTIPLSIRHRFTVRAPSGDEFRYDLFLEGDIVAVQEPLLFVERSPEPGESLRLWWPSEFRLQRSNLYSPVQWLNMEGEPPLDVPTSFQAANFFRASPSN